MKYFSDVMTPLGRLRVIVDERSVVGVGFNPDRNTKLANLDLTGKEGESALSRNAARQLEEYFAGKRKVFELPVCFGERSAFAASVLDCLAGVPYGELLSYGALAVLSGHPHAARAVGRVMAANPVPIIVPCHRIVGSSGKLTGYSGGDGIATKEWLLSFEAANNAS